MQPSNTSHNKTSFGGVLQPLVDMLGHSQRTGERLVGQEVVTNDKSVRVIIALDAENDIHLLISPVPDKDSRFSKLDLKGLKIDTREWGVAGLPAQMYLDLSCVTGKQPSFKRPFLRFAEDVLYEIDRSGLTPADAVYRTGLRWRRFWSADISAEVTREWLHGIFGELLFLDELINRFGGNIIENWNGPLGSDHDFQTGTDLAVEIKTSTETPFKIHCNIRQLDSKLFNKLYIVCYKLSSSENGMCIPELVRRIEAKLGDDVQMLDKFYERLSSAGYHRQLEPQYDEFALNTSDAGVFKVDEKFPKIAESSFINPPDHRISNIRYTLQLTGLDELKVDDISDDLKKLSNEKQ